MIWYYVIEFYCIKGDEIEVVCCQRVLGFLEVEQGSFKENVGNDQKEIYVYGYVGFFDFFVFCNYNYFVVFCFCFNYLLVCYKIF